MLLILTHVTTRHSRSNFALVLPEKCSCFQPMICTLFFQVCYYFMKCILKQKVQNILGSQFVLELVWTWLQQEM